MVYVAERLRGMATNVSHVAVKKLDLDSMQGQREFVKELHVLGVCRHVAALLSFSAVKGEEEQAWCVCLVTPLMRGGSLDDRLFLTREARARLGMIHDTRSGTSISAWSGITTILGDGRLYSGIACDWTKREGGRTRR